MKNYLNLLLFVLIAVLMISVSALISQNINQTKEINRQKQNVFSLNDTISQIKNKNGEYISKISSMTYTIDEYERFMAKDAQTIKDMNIKLKNALNSTKIVTVTETKFKERIIIQPDSTTCFDYTDGWTSISACFNKDSIAGNFSNREELFLVVHTERTKKFLWWRYGTKITNITAKSENKNTTISELKYTILKN